MVLIVKLLKFFLSIVDSVSLASIYDTLKLLNILCKSSLVRTEQASHDVVLPLKELITYIDHQGDEITRRKRIKLLTSALSIFHKMVAASELTR